MAPSEWVGLDAPVTVAGAPLTGVYVGPADTPEVVDPELPIDVTAPDWDGASVGELHYGHLTPQARAAYLVWQRTGRRAPRAPAAWALLHLYGLERRILLDGVDDTALRTEAAALGQLYGHEPEVARVAAALTGHNERAAPPPLEHDALPDDLQVELGRRALASEPVDASWALPWAWYHPEIPHREAATQVPTEFARLWSLRFTERFPQGMPVGARRRRLTLDHVPANPSLPTPLEYAVHDASDVFLTPGPATALREVTDQVESELGAFVRWRARWPDEPTGSVRAAGALPRALLDGSEAEQAARPLVDLARSVLAGTAAGIVESGPLLDNWCAATGQETIERRDAVEIAQVLERFGVGIEPDVRFGGRPFTRRSPAVLFRLAGAPTTSPSEAYATALVTLELCAAVAAADGTVDEAEQAMLVERIGRAEGLTDAERVRLDAHRLLVTSSHLRLDDVASRMVGLSVTDRHALATHLLDLARADGVVTDDEVVVLRAVHELLDLDPDEVDRRLRPRTVPLAPRPAGVGQPAPDDAPTRLVEVDEDRLAATQENNRLVQALLGDLFETGEDDEPLPGATEPTEAPPASSGPVISTLDPAHSALLSALAARGRTGRPELEALALGHRVLPDGAIDVINEAAIDLTEDPVVETADDESVTVDPDVYEEMCA